MNTLTQFGSEPTMTSQEIADLTGKRHDNVRRTIETLAERGVIALPQIEEKPTNGRPSLVFVLKGDRGKRDSYIIVAQLSPEFTAQLVDRWQELEAKAAPDPMVALNDPTVMRGLLLSYSEKVLALEERNAALSPKADALDRISTAQGSLCLTDAAKALQVPPREFIGWLQQHRWIFRRQGTPWLGYSEKTRMGMVEHKVTTVSRPDGSEKITEQVRITPAGLAKLASLHQIGGLQ